MRAARPATFDLGVAQNRGERARRGAADDHGARVGTIHNGHGFTLTGSLRSVRKGLFGVAVSAAVVASLSGCGDSPHPQTPSNSQPARSSSPSTRSTPALRVRAPVGSDGLDIRRLDSTGKVATVRVRDFPR